MAKGQKFCDNALDRAFFNVTAQHPMTSCKAVCDNALDRAFFNVTGFSNLTNDEMMDVIMPLIGPFLMSHFGLLMIGISIVCDNALDRAFFNVTVTF